MQQSLAVEIDGVSHHYREHQALNRLSFHVHPHETFVLLGPNGSGKTTLFRLISTLARLQEGEISVGGHSLRRDVAAVRNQLGIVFQSPSLDPKLTVMENVRCQAALYGIGASDCRVRVEQLLDQLGVADRASTPTEQLSGGLKRRVELLKGMLHRPQLLLMDEPSTGLDPASRIDLWHAVDDLKRHNGVTVLMTTHLLEEAEKADRIGIMHRGEMVAVGKPDDLRCQLGKQVLTLHTSAPAKVTQWLTEQGVTADLVGETLRVTAPNAAELVAPLASQFEAELSSISLAQPSLEDVFIAKTGHQFWNERR